MINFALSSRGKCKRREIDFLKDGLKLSDGGYFFAECVDFSSKGG